MAIAPVVLAAALYSAVPFMFGLYPSYQPLYPIVVSFFCLITSEFPAYIFAFVVLDERDQQIDEIFRVLPVDRYSITVFRMGVMWLIAFIVSLVCLAIGGLFSIGVSVGIAFAISAISPLTFAMIIMHAENKIEGVALVKFVNMLWILPIAGILIHLPWGPLLGAIPTFWYFLWFTEGNLSYGSYLLFWLITGLYTAYFVYFKKSAM